MVGQPETLKLELIGSNTTERTRCRLESITFFGRAEVPEEGAQLYPTNGPALAPRRSARRNNGILGTHMSWECKYKSGDQCRRLDLECDPGRKGCVLHGRVYFPFAPEKNSKAISEAAREERENKKPK